MNENDILPCFNQQQWEAWHQAAQSSPPKPEDGECSDCTPQYQRGMVLRGKCRYPGTKFIIGDDGYEGVRPRWVPVKLVRHDR